MPVTDRNSNEEAPSPVHQVGDRGLASPEPASSTQDEEPDSALGGGTATRTATDAGEAQDRSE